MEALNKASCKPALTGNPIFWDPAWIINRKWPSIWPKKPQFYGYYPIKGHDYPLQFINSRCRPALEHINRLRWQTGCESDSCFLQFHGMQFWRSQTTASQSGPPLQVVV
jgi:hypothetical protein